MNHFTLSKKTQEDIDAIYEFGVHKFGENQALNYLLEMRSHLELLLSNPEIGKQRNEIKDGLYSLPYASHIIFYRILKNHLRIVRVLHGNRDLRKFLK
ncbi:toxin ParE1/3/4 [Leeuwenhoekiella aestuarii]|uniref:Toxin n=1 Tax=Leeuwenhoekiella aestuarii TaxID=2249426 RepID=A0A4Q0NZ97_9FLAO|nr:type II toxin-antitoxin system RelE/ParE family toxin [Leeuwenhoekiella aestuarii]RXG15968.1 toxin ParE1/3/4 [Leeuwenhoekiella aestuarii]RXG16662.1 toxin ParE1/3/4 [Leeuwenhoekiella aestuarii]